MARKTSTLPRGTFHVVMYAYCGMAYAVGSGDMSESQARDAVKRFAQRRERDGYTLAQLAGTDWLEVEIGEPEDSALVPDDAGVIRVIEETDPAVECFDCGSLVRIGESCDCHETTADDDDMIAVS